MEEELFSHAATAKISPEAIKQGICTPASMLPNEYISNSLLSTVGIFKDRPLSNAIVPDIACLQVHKERNKRLLESASKIEKYIQALRVSQFACTQQLVFLDRLKDKIQEKVKHSKYKIRFARIMGGLHLSSMKKSIEKSLSQPETFSIYQCAQMNLVPQEVPQEVPREVDYCTLHTHTFGSIRMPMCFIDVFKRHSTKLINDEEKNIKDIYLCPSIAQAKERMTCLLQENTRYCAGSTLASAIYQELVDAYRCYISLGTMQDNTPILELALSLFDYVQDINASLTRLIDICLRFPASSSMYGIFSANMLDNSVDHMQIKCSNESVLIEQIHKLHFYGTITASSHEPLSVVVDILGGHGVLDINQSVTFDLGTDTYVNAPSYIFMRMEI